MDLKDKIVGLSLAAAIGLIGWNLNETTKMRTEILQIQQFFDFFLCKFFQLTFRFPLDEKNLEHSLHGNDSLDCILQHKIN